MSKKLKKERQIFVGDDNNIKCGEIIFSNNTKFCFSCIFCQRNCEKVQEFFRHVLYDHLNYLDDYQFEEDAGFLLNQNKTTEDVKEFGDIDIFEDAKIIKKIDFSNHFEEFVCQKIPNSISIKSEDEDEDEEDDLDYKDNIEEFEFLLENDHPAQSQRTQSQRSQSPDSKNNFDDILHIEFLEEPSENEYEPENIEISEPHSLKNENNEADDGEDFFEDDVKDDGEYDVEDDDENDEESAIISSPEDEQYFSDTNKSENQDEDEDEVKNNLTITNDLVKKGNKFKCTYPHCKRVFLTKNGAKRHIQKVHHDNSTNLTCEKCFKTFRNRSVLQQHTLRHMGIKPYPCEICGQFFSDKSNLNVHVQRHKGIKPHACALCQKRFHSSTELKLHMRSHTGERPFVCELCGRKFSNSGHLCSHRRRHTNEKKFECEFCQKRFFDRKLLNDHKVMHTDERPFECSTCGATFQRKKALLQHEKLHSGIKQYVCKICGKSFAQNAGLYSHMKGH